MPVEFLYSGRVKFFYGLHAFSITSHMAMDSEISFEFGNSFNSSIIGADDSLKNSSMYLKLVCCLLSCIEKKYFFLFR